MNIGTKTSRKGFTLVELLVVIAIIVALAALATPQIFKALKRGNAKADKHHRRENADEVCQNALLFLRQIDR